MSTTADQLEKLAALLAQGLLTEEEFDQEKERVLKASTSMATMPPTEPEPEPEPDPNLSVTTDASLKPDPADTTAPKSNTI